MKARRKAALILAVLIVCVACDQVSKVIAKARLSLLPRQSLLGDVFRLEYTENLGAFLGMGATLSPEVRFWLLVVGVSVVLVGMLVYLFTQDPGRLSVWGGALIVSGGFSNLIDRFLHHGAVVDFMNLGIGTLRTGIFNVADVALMAGIGLMLVDNIRSIHPKKTDGLEDVSQSPTGE
ncbi:MAG TPA: signal peptidase II [Anaerolineae bacterium]|nr:signal peptidase II [Anaerolineae bacterium]